MIKIADESCGDIGPKRQSMAILKNFAVTNSTEWMLFAPEFLAKMSLWRDNAPDLPDDALASFTSLRESCENFDPLGLCSRMFPDFSVQTADETLRKSSAFSWSSAGMGFRGVCSTADISESPNAAAECSLSDVLEDHAPQRFYLSPMAARGILRRAKKRGRTLPERLQIALSHLAIGTTPTEKSTLSPMRSQQERDVLEAEEPTTEPISFQLSLPLSKEDSKEDSEANRKNISSLLPFLPVGDCRPMETGTTCKSPTPCAKIPAASVSVRRLTPAECEKLQGFPEGWTLVDIDNSEML